VLIDKEMQEQAYERAEMELASRGEDDRWALLEESMVRDTERMREQRPGDLVVTRLYSHNMDVDSINDGSFAVQMPSSPAATVWVDIPAKAHNNACGFSFADGHSEIHKWLQPGNIDNVDYTTKAKDPTAHLYDPDITWVARHTSLRSDGKPLSY